jgi:hypothetical protein
MGKLHGTDLVSAIASAITKMEGTIPPGPGYPNGSLAYQNNNPGNLIYNRNGWNYPGATLGAGGFARFPDPATGQAALDHQIQVQIDSGQNLTQFFNQYAPGGTVNEAGGVQTNAATQNYINMVSQSIGIDPSVPLKSVQDGSYTATSDPTGSGGTDSTTYTATDFPTSDGTTTLSGMLDGLDTPTVIGMGLGIAAVLYFAFK